MKANSPDREEQQKGNQDQTKDKSAILHAGGINDELGGVDPEVDANLMRLSGGP